MLFHVADVGLAAGPLRVLVQVEDVAAGFQIERLECVLVVLLLDQLGTHQTVVHNPFQGRDGRVLFLLLRRRRQRPFDRTRRLRGGGGGGCGGGGAATVAGEQLQPDVGRLGPFEHIYDRLVRLAGPQG